MDVIIGCCVWVVFLLVWCGEFIIDGVGEVCFVYGLGSDNINKLYFCECSGDIWKLINDEVVSKCIEIVFGFLVDDSLVYFNVEQVQGLDVIVSWNLQIGECVMLLCDEVVNLYCIIYWFGIYVLVGVLYLGDMLCI